MKLAIPTAWLPYILKGATGAFVVIAGLLWARAEIWKHRAVDATFRSDSIAAALDTSRTRFLGDRAITDRRLIQVKIERDSLAKALKSRPAMDRPRRPNKTRRDPLPRLHVSHLGLEENKQYAEGRSAPRAQGARRSK